MEIRWDPLEKAMDTASEIIGAAKKREINNILKSYVGFYDPFCELLQNAMDAVDSRDIQLQETDYKKRISIRIDLRDNYIAVTDNGIGFNKDKFETFLCPNISFKDTGSTRGNKGVGATYLAYGFNYLQLATKTPDYICVAEFKDGRKWVDDSQSIVTRPVVTQSKIIHKQFDDIDQGSSFAIKLGGNNIRPKNLTWVSANTAEQWKTILLVKTPLGHISLKDASYKDISFDIEVIDGDGNSSILTDQNAEYIFPHTVIKGSTNLADITTTMNEMLKKQMDPSNIPMRFKNLNAIYTYLDTNVLSEMLKHHPNNNLIKQHSINAYAYFCYSTQLLDEFSDNVAKLRRNMRIIRGGLQLSTNNMPQGDLIRIPLSSSIGYQNQTHIVIHFENADPDLGRKGFQPELRGIAEALSASIVNMLKKWRSHLKKDTGSKPSIASETVLFNWISQQLDHEKNHPLSVTNPHFFIPLNEISITSTPISEQDVIVLFNQLVAGGVIRGIKIMATSSHQQYDGIFKYCVTPPLKNHVFDKDNNPLGVQEMSHSEAFFTKPYVLEYKYNIDALIHEFENGEKTEGDIDLAIAWDIGSEWKKRYQVLSLLDLDNIQHRAFHGQTHVFIDDYSGDIRFYAIILADLMAYFKDVDAIQSQQKKTYGDII